MRRREFISLLGSNAAIPLGARAQGERKRRVGVSMAIDNAEQRESQTVFLQLLQQSGWIDGRNVRIETRWAGGSAAEIRKHANDLVALAPDVIFVGGSITAVFIAGNAAVKLCCECDRRAGLLGAASNIKRN